MRHGDGGRRGPLALSDGVDDGPQQPGHQGFGAIGRPTEEQWRRVAQPPLELATRSRRLGDGATPGRLADEHFTVLA